MGDVADRPSVPPGEVLDVRGVASQVRFLSGRRDGSQEHHDRPVGLHDRTDRVGGMGCDFLCPAGANAVEPAGEQGLAKTIADELLGLGDATSTGRSPATMPASPAASAAARIAPAVPRMGTAVVLRSTYQPGTCQPAS